MAGWKAFYYKNVNEIGAPYRPYGMTELFGSIYSGLVNAKFHNGILKPDKYYELGYAYGGPLTTGYCQWINEYAKNNKIDKILFTSRDMYCVHQVYNSFFKKYDNDYIAISRFAAQRFSYKSFSEYFIDTHIRARAGIEKLTVREALEELEINALYSFLDDYGLKESQLLDMSIYENLKQCMEDHKTEILNEFQEEKEAAIKYYSQFVSKGQRIAVVDLGWQGSNALCLKYLLEKETNLNVEVFSLLMCATGKSFLNHSLSAGIQKAYCFSPQKNSSLMGHFSHHNIGRFLCEMIFTSEEESLKKFEIDEGRIKIVRMPTERRNSEHLKRIISGITDYAREFNNLKIDSSELFVSGLEVILPINKLSYNEKFCINILKEVEVNPWIGVLKNSAASNIEKIVR